MAIRTILVDDEPLAREKLRSFLERETGFEIVEECRDGREALLAIEAERPQLVFLDVQMPELDGFEVLEHLETDSMPVVVFVTAYDQYALKAFEVHAVDYLLKPFDRERFQEAVARARGEVERQEVGDMRGQLAAMLEDLKSQRPAYPERLVIKSSGRVVFLKVSDILWVDAAGNYVKLNTGTSSHQLRETMNGMEKRLDPEKFIRIHRSTIVNIDCIQEMQQQFHGDYVVILNGGQRLTLSRSFRDRLGDLLGNIP